MANLFDMGNGDGSKRPPIYVDSKNDPRYRAYTDSLELSKINTYDNRWIINAKKVDWNNKIIENSSWSDHGGSYPNRTKHEKAYNRLTILNKKEPSTKKNQINFKVGFSGLSGMDNTIDTYFTRYKKPVQPVEVKKPAQQWEEQSTSKLNQLELVNNSYKEKSTLNNIKPSRQEIPLIERKPINLQLPRELPETIEQQQLPVAPKKKNLSGFSAQGAKFLGIDDTYQPELMNTDLSKLSSKTIKDPGFNNGGSMKKTKISMPYKQGGKSYGIVPGDGDPKADDIQMTAKEGHVVPAVNAPIAMNLVSMMGYDPMQNVSLRQGGGTPINISSGEYFLNKEQVAKLKAQGINPEMLSPDSPYNEGEEMENEDDNNEMEEKQMVAKGGRIRLTMPTQEDQNNNQQSSHGSYNHGGPHDGNGTYEDAEKKLKPVDYTKAGRNTNQFMVGQGGISGGSSDADAIRLYGSTENMRNRMRDEDPNFDFGNDVYGPKHADAFNKLNILYYQHPEKWQNGPGEKYGPPANQTANNVPDQLATKPVPKNNNLVDMGFGVPEGPGEYNVNNETPTNEQEKYVGQNNTTTVNNTTQNKGTGNGTGNNNEDLYKDILKRSNKLRDIETVANVGMGLYNLSRPYQSAEKPTFTPHREITRDYQGMINENKQNVTKLSASSNYTLRNLGNTNAMVGVDANAKASELQGSGNIWDLQSQDTMMNVNASNQNRANYNARMDQWKAMDADAKSKFQQAKGANIAQNVNQIFTVQDAALNKEAQLKTYQNQYDIDKADTSYDAVMAKIASNPKAMEDIKKKFPNIKNNNISRMDWRNDRELRNYIEGSNYSNGGPKYNFGGNVNLPSDLQAERSLKDLVRTNFSGNSLLSLGQS